ncbi:hypothetical protein L6452_01403 [Arctium lappa]|uniref:Uncharacterized protein n=1 Tax=Arctium lappa TaxID=4217 RepID=A0ACB9FHW3_ARCLA|nr:hypothetical protein L6452_01403 [Arctium lappa]
MLDWKFSQEERSQDWKSRGLAYLLSLIKQLPRGSRCGTVPLFSPRSSLTLYLMQNYTDHVGEKSTFRLLNRGSAKALAKVAELYGASFGSAAKQTGLKALEFTLSICDAVDMYGFTVDQEWTRYFSESRQGHTPLQCRSKLIYAAYSMCKIILHIFNGHKTKEGENELKTDSKKRKAIETAGLQKTTQTEIDTKIPTKKQKSLAVVPQTWDLLEEAFLR